MKIFYGTSIMNTYTGQNSAFESGFLRDGASNSPAYYMTTEKSTKTLNFVDGAMHGELVMQAKTFAITPTNGEKYLNFIVNAVLSKLFSGHSVYLVENVQLMDNYAAATYTFDDGSELYVSLSKTEDATLVKIGFIVRDYQTKLSNLEIDAIYVGLVGLEALIGSGLHNAWRPPPPKPTKEGKRATRRRTTRHRTTRRRSKQMA